MKNTTHILKALLLSILTSLFFSCNNSLIFTNTSSVGFTVSPEVFKAVRAADDSAQVISMEVTLTKNGTNEDIISKDYDDIPEDTESFVFNNIPVGTKVQATVKITNGDVVLEGTSEEKVVSLGKVILQIKLARSDVEGKKIPADGSLVIEEASIIINLLDSAECYNNTKSLTFSVTDDEDNAVIATNWTATLYYGGRKVDGTSITDGKFSFGAEHIRSGDYQLYVTAEYEGVTASSTFDLNVLDMAKFEMDVGAYSDDDFSSAFEALINNLWSDALFVLTGNGNVTTINNVFYKSFASDTYSVTVDMSAVKGIITLGSQSITLKPTENSSYSCLQKIIFPDSLTKIEEKAFKSSGSAVTFKDNFTVSLGSNVSSISFPNNTNYSPFRMFEVSSDNNYFKTNEDGTLLLNKTGDTIVWAGNIERSKMPDEIKNIGKGAFYGCCWINTSSENDVSLNNVVVIYEYAFTEASNSRNFVVTSSLQAIGAYAFDFSHNFIDEDTNHPSKWYTTFEYEKWASRDISTLTSNPEIEVSSINAKSFNNANGDVVYGINYEDNPTYALRKPE